MSNFSINEMQSMQKELQDKYKEKWGKESVRRPAKISFYG